jgi:hypothetical protein
MVVWRAVEGEPSSDERERGKEGKSVPGRPRPSEAPFLTTNLEATQGIRRAVTYRREEDEMQRRRGEMRCGRGLDEWQSGCNGSAQISSGAQAGPTGLILGRANWLAELAQAKLHRRLSFLLTGR